MSTPHILGIGGTTRPNSSSEKALRRALAAAEAEGATTSAVLGAELEALPPFAPERPERAEAAVRLIDELRRAGGVIVASPAYHGSISGMIKNALDYAEDLREDERSYLDGLAFGCVATGAGWQGVVAALTHLRSIAHALRAWPTPLGAGVNATTGPFDEAGEVVDEKVAFQLDAIGRDVVAFARQRAALASA